MWLVVLLIILLILYFTNFEYFGDMEKGSYVYDPRTDFFTGLRGEIIDYKPMPDCENTFGARCYNSKV